MGSRTENVIAAAFVVLSLLTVGGHGHGHGHDPEHERSVQFYLECIELFDRDSRGDFLSDDHTSDAFFGCGLGLDDAESAYRFTGRLRPAYVEALKMWFEGNQTLIDMEICRIDLSRCPEQTARLLLDENRPDNPYDPRFNHTFN
ncbi:hypothetical protein OROHE_026772 [Orobanche hederae]